MDDNYNNIDDYNLNRNCKILVVFDDIIADMTKKKILVHSQMIIY